VGWSGGGGAGAGRLCPRIGRPPKRQEAPQFLVCSLTNVLCTAGGRKVAAAEGGGAA
jgi:hypothetical protein